MKLTTWLDWIDTHRSEEQHLGGYIRDYLQGNFVVDVHPPLGKMLFSLVAYLLGYDGKFDFISGKYVPFSLFSVKCLNGICFLSFCVDILTRF